MVEQAKPIKYLRAHALEDYSLPLLERKIKIYLFLRTLTSTLFVAATAIGWVGLGFLFWETPGYWLAVGALLSLVAFLLWFYRYTTIKAARLSKWHMMLQAGRTTGDS